MGGLGGEHHALFATRTALAYGVVVAVEVMEGGMRQPSFIKMQGINFAIQHFFYFFYVI